MKFPRYVVALSIVGTAAGSIVLYKWGLDCITVDGSLHVYCAGASTWYTKVSVDYVL